MFARPSRVNVNLPGGLARPRRKYGVHVWCKSRFLSQIPRIQCVRNAWGDAQGGAHTVMEASLKVLIADDHPLMLQGIRRALEASEDIDVVGEARCGEELLALAERRKPDLVLLDAHMPGLNRLESVAALPGRWPAVHAVRTA